ncbi:hypothetical protein F5Y15DRAFT_258810 [Xylariaceae sp. FL0016]|nr:hypothetical protein F5Y15DRAFT_258810 [Xylariaceae sp. FL0016]
MRALLLALALASDLPVESDLIFLIHSFTDWFAIIYQIMWHISQCSCLASQPTLPIGWVVGEFMLYSVRPGLRLMTISPISMRATFSSWLSPASSAPLLAAHIDRE